VRQLQFGKLPSLTDTADKGHVFHCASHGTDTGKRQSSATSVVPLTGFPSCRAGMKGVS
jgi:hypothetical protein